MSIDGNVKQLQIIIDGNTYQLDYTHSTARLLRGGGQTEVIINKYVTFYGRQFALVEIGKKSFEKLTTIHKLNIEAEGLIIGEQAFSRCPNLQVVSISGHVSSVGKYAFQACNKLEELLIDGSIEHVETRAFSFCSCLKNVIMRGNAINLGEGMFKFCTSLTSITIPEGVQSIPNYTFEGCPSLCVVHLPKTLVDIGKDAFCNCTSLHHINIRCTESYYDYCFRGTPQHPTWWRSHPRTLLQKQNYSVLDEILSNLVSGKVLSKTRSIYDSNGNIVSGDNLFYATVDFHAGTSIHYTISESIRKTLYQRSFGDKILFYHPVGQVYSQVILGQPHYIRLIENGKPLGKATTRHLLEEGIPMEFIFDEGLWMREFINSNPGIIDIITDALYGIGFPVPKEEVISLSLSRIPTDDSWSERDKNQFDNNYLCKLVKAIQGFYESINNLYKRKIISISGKLLFDNAIYFYIHIVNLIKYHQDCCVII